MRKGSLAVTALTGLVSWSALASAAETPAAKKPAPAASVAPSKSDAPGKPGATPPEDEAPTTKGTTQPAPSDTPHATTPAPSTEDAAKPTDTAGGSEESPAGGPAPSEPAPAPRPSPGPGAARAATGFGAVGLFPEPSRSTPAASTQLPAAAPKSTESVLAEDWWSHARPVFEIHGYFRTRAELFHNFSLGRTDNPLFAVWPQPTDNSYSTPTGGAVGPKLCTPSEAGGGSDNPALALVQCKNKTQAGANIRFRLDPELHISDNLRIISQVDILDDVVLGSTPSGYGFQPSGTGYQVTQRPGYAPNSVLDDTTVAPHSGINSLGDSIVVKRVWAEYTTPVGELRFGRMPDHFGLGMVHNSGDGYDDDYQST
ncbi:MAG TPA: hypothetical protein VHU80_13230, partial [Polyangiaceae bacterium]|nr:hypothetical protein [Polyangiaceae bacterium]